MTDVDEAEHDADVDPDEGDSFVRSFTLTGGRTRNDRVEVAIHTVVCQSSTSQSLPPKLAPVETDIWIAAGDRLSPAEMSSRLGIPLGVVRVLVGDLVTDGLVDLGKTTSTGDAKLVRRLIDGVRAL